MVGIDRRRHYVLILDTETANTQVTADGKLDMSYPLVYDVGYCVADTRGNIYETASYVNADIFIGCFDIMQKAYYADKIPLYWDDINKGTTRISSTYTIRQDMLKIIERYRIREVLAYNLPFDYRALNCTQRYTTSSKYRYWFPYDSGIEYWDIMRMTESVICKMPSFRKFCEKNGFLTKTGRPQKTAEVVYKFIVKNPDFVESHTGLSDVLIEAAIMRYCYRQKKAMRKHAFKEREKPEKWTEFQHALYESIRQMPVISMSGGVG